MEGHDMPSATNTTERRTAQVAADSAREAVELPETTAKLVAADAAKRTEAAEATPVAKLAEAAAERAATLAAKFGPANRGEIAARGEARPAVWVAIAADVTLREVTEYVVSLLMADALSGATQEVGYLPPNLEVTLAGSLTTPEVIGRTQYKGLTEGAVRSKGAEYVQGQLRKGFANVTPSGWRILLKVTGQVARQNGDGYADTAVVACQRVS